MVVNMTISQRPTRDYPSRNKVLRLSYLNYYEFESSWADLTDKGKVVLPRNLYYRDKENKVQNLKKGSLSIGGFNAIPLLLRGDKVQVSSGYTFFKNGKQVTVTNNIFTGFISKVYSKTPIEIDVEDNMWLLKQTPLPNRTFAETDTLETMLQWICDYTNKYHGTGITYKANSKTFFGQFITYNETAAQVLARIKSSYGIISYFQGDVLNCGVLVQYPSTVKNHIFHMNGENGNVPADGQELDYQRKDDIVLSAIAHNTITEKTGSQTKDGKDKTKKKRIEVLVTFRNDRVESRVIEAGERIPESDEGERREFYYPSAKTEAELIELATAELQRYYYTGLRGSYSAFGLPHVSHGDMCKIYNPEFPEQEGIYRTKKVIRYGGPGIGLRQEIHIDYRINT